MAERRAEIGLLMFVACRGKSGVAEMDSGATPVEASVRRGESNASRGAAHDSLEEARKHQKTSAALYKSSLDLRKSSSYLKKSSEHLKKSSAHHQESRALLVHSRGADSYRSTASRVGFGAKWAASVMHRGDSAAIGREVVRSRRDAAVSARSFDCVCT
jgi:hypothetical protein